MQTRSTRSALTFSAAAVLLAFGSMAFAAGSAPSTSSSSSSSTTGSSSAGGVTQKCAQFKANSSAWKKCLKGGRTSMNNEDLYAAGYYLAKAGEYNDALEFLNAGTDKRDVRFLTMIGYANRKMGKVDEGMSYYMQALALDPNSVTTREYLGEAYLQIKDLPKAEAQLTEIQSRCGLTCESYTQLKTEIAKYQATL